MSTDLDIYNPAKVRGIVEGLQEQLAATQAEARELREVLGKVYISATLPRWANDAAAAALSQPAEQAPLIIRCQVCEHHTPVVFESEPAQREARSVSDHTCNACRWW